MRFDAVFNIEFILLIIAPITLAFVWLEWRRVHKFRSARIVAVFLMMFALLGIFLKPEYRTNKTSSILLMTPGYVTKKVDSILRVHPSLDLMHLEKTTSYKNSKLLTYYDLVDQGTEIRFIVGRGLPAHALDLWDDKNYEFIPAELPEGITSLNIPSTTYANRKSTLSGTIESREENVWLYLKSPAANEDSVRLSRGKNHFELSFTPRYTGDFLYTLFTSATLSENHRDDVPIHVEEGYPIRILFLQHHPTFEAQQLKQFLGRKKNLVTVRNQVSKNNFRYEYINTTPVQINHLSQATLENMDLVIADNESLQILSAIEKAILKHSIESGLGLLNISSNTNQKKSALFPFEIVPVKTDTAHIAVEDRWFTLPATSIRVIKNSELIPIHKNKNRVLSGYTFSGIGKIGFQLLEETYRLALSGDSTAYASYWSPLLEKITRTKSADSKIKIVTPFPWFENEPMDIEIISAAENALLFDDSLRIPLVEDVNIDNVWYGRTWATSSGWHTLKTGAGSSLSYYVFKQNSWHALSISNQMEITKQRANPKSSSGENIQTWKEIQPVLWYVFFLIAAGFLWLAPKL
jgi:hypothetical protein